VGRKKEKEYNIKRSEEVAGDGNEEKKEDKITE
jgi:hypothetical protein